MGSLIRCPSCRCEFELSDVLRSELEAEVRAQMGKQFARELEQARKQEASAARERFAKELDEQVRVTQEALGEAQAKIRTMAEREADLLKKQRDVENRERELALETERRVAAEVAKAREQETKLAQQRAEMQQEQQHLRDEEHRQQIEGLQKTIAELTRKVQQGSQQMQGEAQEVVLKDVLTASFPHDAVEDVPKGVNGADLVQTVRAGDGRPCGSIVWESKRTKGWSDGWLPKLREDQRAAGGACAVLVTQALPGDVRHFGLKDGVWVCAPAYAVPLAAALRAGLVEASIAKRAAEGSGQKMQLLYDYMMGTEFRNRVEGLVEAFMDIQDDHASEKRSTLTRWKRREKILERALQNIASLCGDLEGISGRQLQDLIPEPLESLRKLPEHADEASDTRNIGVYAAG
ncbi:MAG TPA: DUF2130 domain-containing protein [Polyangiaceae bacterium]